MTRLPRILIVDDDPLFRRVMTLASRRQGLEPTLCGSVEELEGALRGGPFDVVVMDYFLEDFRGPEVARSLSETVPVLLTSRTDRCVEFDEAWPSCIRGFVSKDEGHRRIVLAALSLVEAKGHPRMPR